jgi:hypothetical protein
LIINPSQLQGLLYEANIGSVLVGPVIDSRDYATLVASFHSFRVNAAMVHVEYVHNDLENQGQLQTGTFLNTEASPVTTNPWPASWPFTLGDQLPNERFGTLRDGACVCCTYTDSTSHEFIPIARSSQQSVVEVNNNFTSVGILLAGAKPGTLVVQVTVVQDIELLAPSRSFLSRVHSPGMPSNATARDIINDVNRAIAPSAALTVAQPAGGMAASVAKATKTVSSIGTAAANGTSFLKGVGDALGAVWNFGKEALPFMEAAALMLL